jgi:hypothetical protein
VAGRTVTAQERFDALSRAYPQEAEELIQAKVIEWQYEIGHDYEQGYEID